MLNEIIPDNIGFRLICADTECSLEDMPETMDDRD